MDTTHRRPISSARACAATVAAALLASAAAARPARAAAPLWLPPAPGLRAPVGVLDELTPEALARAQHLGQVRAGACTLTPSSTTSSSEPTLQCTCLELRTRGWHLYFGRLERDASGAVTIEGLRWRALKARADATAYRAVRLEANGGPGAPAELEQVRVQTPHRRQRLHIEGLEVPASGALELQGLTWSPRGAQEPLSAPHEASCPEPGPGEAPPAPPRARASAATYTPDQGWQLEGVRRGVMLRARTLEASAAQRSGWLPARASAGGGAAALELPYYIAPLHLAPSPYISPGQVYGVSGHVLTRLDPRGTGRALRLIGGLDPAGQLRASAAGSAALGDPRRHLMLGFERGPDALLGASALNRGGWSRGWTQDRVGAALHEDDLTLQVWGVREGDQFLRGHLLMGTEYPLSERVTLELGGTHRATRHEAALHRTRLTPGARLRLGQRGRAWAEGLVGGALRYDLRELDAGQAGSSRGLALLVAQGGLDLEGRLGPWRHRIEPSAMIAGAPITYEKLAATGQPPDPAPPRWGLARLGLEQELVTPGGARLKAPASLWGTIAPGRAPEVLGHGELLMSAPATARWRPRLHLEGCVGGACQGAPRWRTSAGVTLGHHLSFNGVVSAMEAEIAWLGWLMGSGSASASDASLLERALLRPAPPQAPPKTYGAAASAQLGDHQIESWGYLASHERTPGLMARYGYTPAGAGWQLGLAGAARAGASRELFIQIGWVGR